MLFTGEYEQHVSKAGIEIPEDIRERLAAELEWTDAALGPVWISMPCLNDSIWIWPMNIFRRMLHAFEDASIDPQTATRVNLWSARTRALNREFTIRPGIPLLPPQNHPRSVRSALETFAKLLPQRSRDAKPRLKGRDLERFAAEVLADAGCQVQLNLQLGGGEVDLLGFGYKHDGTPGYILLECKNYSDRPVSVSEVRSLFGLREIVKEQMPVSHTVLVSTSGFSGPAHVAAKIFGLKLIDHDALAEWASQNRASSAAIPAIPLHYLSRQGTRGHIEVPFATKRLLGGTAVAVVLGVRDHLVLLGAEELRRRREERSLRNAKVFQEARKVLQRVKKERISKLS